LKVLPGQKEELFPRVEDKSMTIYIRDQLISFQQNAAEASNTNSSNTKGRVTSMGLDIRPRTKNRRTKK